MNDCELKLNDFTIQEASQHFGVLNLTHLSILLFATIL